MEEVDAEISEMKLFLNGRARFVAEGYLAQVPVAASFILTFSLHNLGVIQ
jgi:ARP2/3 complex 20 kDa subunit (ARPC4)